METTIEFSGHGILPLGIGIVGGGTPMVLLDLSSLGLLGSQAETTLARAGIASNRNPVPFDAPNPSKWTGLSLGVAAATTRGLDVAGMEVLGACIAELIHAEARADPGPALARAGPRIAQLARDLVWFEDTPGREVPAV